MKRASGSLRKEISFKHSWQSIFAAGLLMLILAAFFSPVSVSTSFAFAASHLSARRGSYASSPSQGPVGAVITVTGSGTGFSDGTQIDLGYTTDWQTCTGVSDSQPGVVHGGAFSGWFRWPAGTGTNTFQLCASANGSNSPFFLNNATYTVLSTSPPQVSITPARLDAGKQATVSGTNFLPGGTSVNLFWRATGGGQSISLGTATSDGTGAFTQAFTVPAKSGTGSYILTVTAGGGQPPAMSASTTVPVNGITIVAVPTPTAHPSPTATPTAPATPTAASNAVRVSQPADSTKNAAPTGTNNAGLLLVIGLVGLLAIIAALAGGVFVVRKQRGLAVTAAPGGPASWHATADMVAGSTTMPGTTYPPGSLPPANHAGPDPVTMPYASAANGQSRGAIPFDPGLLEAMREAQVSLFATPRPPVAHTDMPAASALPEPFALAEKVHSS